MNRSQFFGYTFWILTGILTIVCSNPCFSDTDLQLMLEIVPDVRKTEVILVGTPPPPFQFLMKAKIRGKTQAPLNCSWEKTGPGQLIFSRQESSCVCQYQAPEDLDNNVKEATVTITANARDQQGRMGNLSFSFNLSSVTSATAEPLHRLPSIKQVRFFQEEQELIPTNSSLQLDPDKTMALRIETDISNPQNKPIRIELSSLIATTDSINKTYTLPPNPPSHDFLFVKLVLNETNEVVDQKKFIIQTGLKQTEPKWRHIGYGKYGFTYEDALAYIKKSKSETNVQWQLPSIQQLEQLKKAINQGQTFPFEIEENVPYWTRDLAPNNKPRGFCFGSEKSCKFVLTGKNPYRDFPKNDALAIILIKSDDR